MQSGAVQRLKLMPFVRLRPVGPEAPQIALGIAADEFAGSNRGR